MPAILKRVKKNCHDCFSFNRCNYKWKQYINSPLKNLINKQNCEQKEYYAFPGVFSLDMFTSVKCRTNCRSLASRFKPPCTFFIALG